MATLVWNEDFETNTIGQAFPNGGANDSIDSTQAFSGTKSAKMNGDPAYGYKLLTSSNIWVVRFYIRLAAIPSQGIELATIPGFGFGIDNATKKFGVLFGTAQTMTGLSTVTPVINQWYRIDLRLNSSANPWVLDWQIDGVAQTQQTNAAAASSGGDLYMGHTTGFAVAVNVNYDLVSASNTSADYPLGPPGTTVVAPPATFTASSVAPVVSDTVVSPPAATTYASVAPQVSIIVTAPPATFTAQSVSPAVSGTALVIAPPATFTASSVAPTPGVTTVTAWHLALVNLISNGTFETDLSGWVGRGGATISRDTSLFHGGVASGHLVSDASNHDFYGTGVGQAAINVITGQEYTISMWVYVQTGTSASCYIDQNSVQGYITTTGIAGTSTIGSWVFISRAIKITNPVVTKINPYMQIAPVA